MRRTANVRVGELAGYKYVSPPKMFGMNIRIELKMLPILTFTFHLP